MGFFSKVMNVTNDFEFVKWGSFRFSVSRERYILWDSFYHTDKLSM